MTTTHNPCFKVVIHNYESKGNTSHSLKHQLTFDIAFIKDKISSDYLLCANVPLMTLSLSERELDFIIKDNIIEAIRAVFYCSNTKNRYILNESSFITWCYHDNDINTTLLSSTNSSYYKGYEHCLGNKKMEQCVNNLLNLMVDKYNCKFLSVNPDIGLLVKIEDDKIAEMYKFNSFGQLSSGDNCGINLLLTNDLDVPPNARGYAIDYQLSAQSDADYGYFLMPRSSIGNTELIQANSVGLIDPCYRGHLIAKVHNLGATMQSKKKGESITQIVMPNVRNQWYMQRVSWLNDTTRGSGGFGSTGK